MDFIKNKIVLRYYVGNSGIWGAKRPVIIICGLPGRHCVPGEVRYCLQNQSISLKDTDPDGAGIYGTIHIRSVS